MIIRHQGNPPTNACVKKSSSNRKKTKQKKKTNIEIRVIPITVRARGKIPKIFQPQNYRHQPKKNSGDLRRLVVKLWRSKKKPYECSCRGYLKRETKSLLINEIALTTRIYQTLSVSLSVCLSSLSLSRHPPLSFIYPDGSSKLRPVSAQSRCM